MLGSIWSPFEVTYDEFIVDQMFQVFPVFCGAAIKNSECFHPRLTEGISNQRDREI